MLRAYNVNDIRTCACSCLCTCIILCAVSIEDAHRRNDLELFKRFKRSSIILGCVTIASSQVETVDEIVWVCHWSFTCLGAFFKMCRSWVHCIKEGNLMVFDCMDFTGLFCTLLPMFHTYEVTGKVQNSVRLRTRICLTITYCCAVLRRVCCNAGTCRWRR